MWFFFSSFTIWPVTGTAFCVPCFCLFACVSKNWTLWKTKLHNLRLCCNYCKWAWPKRGLPLLPLLSPEAKSLFQCPARAQGGDMGDWIVSCLLSLLGKTQAETNPAFLRRKSISSHTRRSADAARVTHWQALHISSGFFFTLQALIPNWILVEREFGLARERRWNR